MGLDINPLKTSWWPKAPNPPSKFARDGNEAEKQEQKVQ